MKEAVIVSAVRSPASRFQGLPQSFSAPQLGALVVREAVRSAVIEPPSATPSVPAAPALVTLLHALPQHGKTKGIASLCLGGGNAVALAVDRVKHRF
jgi:acetyl-CoA acetyltransferase